ncbi:MAG: hypothetical protein ACE5KK_06375 [Candidatus Brocadiales bacterium]
MVKRSLVLVVLLLISGSGCGTLLPPLLGPAGSPPQSNGTKAVVRVHEKGLLATNTAKTDKQLAVVEELTKRAMDKVSLQEVYPTFQPSLAEKIAYTAQFAGKAIEKTAPVFPLAPVVGGGITLLGSMVATGLGWGRLMRARKMLTLAVRDKEEVERTAGTLIDGIENFSSNNTEAGRLLKELIRNKSIASGTSTRLHKIVREKTL